MKIVVGFSRPKSKMAISQLIRYYMGTPYTHAYISFRSDKFDRELLYEASHGSCHFQEYNNFKDKNIICSEFSSPITEENKIDLVKFCIDNAQKKYGLITLIGIFFGIKLGQDGDKTFICHELVCRALGLNPLDFKTPKDLYLWAEKNMEKNA